MTDPVETHTQNVEPFKAPIFIDEEDIFPLIGGRDHTIDRSRKFKS